MVWDPFQSAGVWKRSHLVNSLKNEEGGGQTRDAEGFIITNTECWSYFSTVLGFDNTKSFIWGGWTCKLPPKNARRPYSRYIKLYIFRLDSEMYASSFNVHQPISAPTQIDTLPWMGPKKVSKDALETALDNEVYAEGAGRWWHGGDDDEVTVWHQGWDRDRNERKMMVLHGRLITVAPDANASHTPVRNTWGQCNHLLMRISSF